MSGGWVELAPWRAARRLYRSPRLDEQPTYWLSWARSVVGLVAVAAISLPYRASTDVMAEAGERAVLVTAGAFGVFLLLAPVVYVRADVHARRMMRTGLPAVVVGLVVILVVAALVYATFAHGLDDVVRSWPLGDLLWGCGTIWLVVFVLTSMVHGTRSVLRIGDVHPLLAPVCAIAGSTALLVVDLVTLDTGGLPLQQWLALCVGGFLLTAAIALLELRLLWLDGARLLRAYDPHALTYEERRRRRRIAGWVVVPVMAAAGVGVVVLVHQAFGGGDLALVAVLVGTGLIGRAVWRRGGEQVRDMLR